MDSNNDRRVMIRPSYYVPAVPAELLREVFGTRTPDAYVEMAVLMFEYWVKGGATPSFTRNKFLENSRMIHSGNIYDFISLLSKRGFVNQFFDLTRPTIDVDGTLRAFLLSNGVSMDTIRYYATWNGMDPRLFVEGFAVGMAESAASIVVSLVQFARLAIQLYEVQLRTVLLLATDLEAGLQSIGEQVTAIAQLFTSIVRMLDPTRLPGEVVRVWNRWNEEFEQHLENLDPRAAGRLLGRIAGDLWQLLTGVIALIKLVRVASRVVLQYASLLFGSIRRAASTAQLVVRDLAALLVAVGRAVVDTTVRVGLGVLSILFPPQVLRKLLRDGRAFLLYDQASIVPVFQEVYATAFGGAPMHSRFAVMVSGEQGRPILMASMSDQLPNISDATRQEAMDALDEILSRLDELFREPKRPPRRVAMSQVAIEAAVVAMVEQRLSTQFRAILQQVAYEAFTELRSTKRKFYANELGRLIHQRMAARIAADINAVSPGITVYTERTLRTVIDDLLKADPNTADEAVQRARGVLNEPVATFVRRRSEILDILGVENTTAARSEQSVTKLLRERFGWRSQTTIGDLQADLIISDTQVKRVINVDWTASTRSDRYTEVWDRIFTDLGKKFKGDPEALSAAYRQAKNSDVPDEVTSGLEQLTRHAVRETVIRKVALEQALGRLWYVTSHELLYDGLKKLYSSTN